nr:hypothetical protein BaRGS_031465 [Batillaria attramentaria]
MYRYLVIDSFGKPSPGISDGNVLWPGAYDLCRDVRVTENMTSVSGDVNETQAFSGQYCTVLDILLVQIPKWRSDETLAMFTNGVNSKGEREPLLNTHTQMYSSQIANYIPWLETSRERYLFQIIANAPVAVDTFFVLSGLLVSYLSLKEMARSRGRLNWFLFYFHRFWRLTPVYMMVLFLYVSVQPHLGRGPAWLAEFNDRDNCKTTWWTNLLYLNNFVKVDKLCMGHTWYLADDMQFYVISPLIFVPFYLSQRDYMADFYIKPYTRMAPYIVGMVAGYILYRRQTRRRMNKSRDTPFYMSDMNLVS